jgi:hypothetical protein
VKVRWTRQEKCRALFEMSESRYLECLRFLRSGSIFLIDTGTTVIEKSRMLADRLLRLLPSVRLPPSLPSLFDSFYGTITSTSSCTLSNVETALPGSSDDLTSAV